MSNDTTLSITYSDKNDGRHITFRISTEDQPKHQDIPEWLKGNEKPRMVV